jgi:vacuolar iron transporter family protein
MANPRRENHFVNRIGWLLGANDGIISTASLIVGVAAAADSSSAVLISGFSGAIAGATLPLLTAIIAPRHFLAPAVFGASLAFLALLGALGAKAGGVHALKPMLRVAFWGALAMALTAGAGALVGKAL